MNGNLVDRLLRKVGARSTEPTYSRLVPSGYQYENKPGEKWPRVLRKRHLTVAALLSASLIVYLLVS
jgi:hypothetical protein